MLSRIPLILAAAALALGATACSSLTKPDEIQIGPEPAPPAPTTIRELPGMPGAGPQGAPAAGAHQGG